jgi:hypothetical protein
VLGGTNNELTPRIVWGEMVTQSVIRESYYGDRETLITSFLPVPMKELLIRIAARNIPT